MTTRLTRRLRRRLPDDRGFSLVEVSVAMFIVMIVFSALLAALLTGIASAKNEQDRAAGNQLAADALEKLRVIGWNKLGFYTTDFATFPDLHDGESVVKLDGAAPADRATDDAPLPTRVVGVNGVDYTVTTWVTWAGSSAASPNDGTTYAAKRIAVDVAWSVRGVSRSVSTAGLRTPTALEMSPPAAASTGAPVSITNASVTGNQTLSASYMLTAPLAVSAETPAPADFVRLTWLQDGTEQTLELVPDATQKYWTKPSGSLLAGAGPFPSGTFTFTFTAGLYSGETQEATSDVVFTAPAGATSFVISSSAVTSGVEPEPHILDTSYRTTSVLTVTATTSTNVDSVTATYRLSTGEQPELALTSTDGGMSWSGTVSVGTGPFSSGSNTFQLTAKKGATTASAAPAVVLMSPALGAIAIEKLRADPVFCEGKATGSSNTEGQLTRDGTLKVNVKNVNAGDTVTFALLDGNATPYWTGSAGTGVSAGSAGFVFTATTPVRAGTAITPTGNQAASVTVQRADGASQTAFLSVAVDHNGNC